MNIIIWTSLPKYRFHVRLLEIHGWYLNRAYGYTSPDRTHYLTEDDIKSMSLSELKEALEKYDNVHGYNVLR